LLGAIPKETSLMPASDRTQQIVELSGIVEEFLQTMRDQTKDLERLVTWLKQQTSLRDDVTQLTVEASRLNALLHRVESLRKQFAAAPGEPSE
jgi:hypothetical protein